MRKLWPSLTPTHFKILAAFWILFSGLVIFWLMQQSPGDRRDNWNVAAVLLSSSGPFAGAIARHFQSCCWHYSLRLSPFCAAFLVFGIFCQMLPFPFTSLERPFRLGSWTLGLLGWFAGVPISFLHALS
jgi:hypothetical protein